MKEKSIARYHGLPQFFDTHSTLFLTGLKGYAVLWIFLIHMGEGFRHLGLFVSRFIEFGKNGVVLFFIVSAIGICITISKKFNFPLYALKRFFRLAPLYYIVLFCAIIFQLKATNAQINFVSIFTHITFTNIHFLIAPEYQGSILGIEWTMPLQFWYYFILPILYFVSFRKNGPVFLLIMGIFLFFHQAIIPYYGPEGFSWSLQKFFVTYVTGVLIYRICFTKFSIKHALLTGSIVLGYLLLQQIDISEIKHFSILYAVFIYQMGITYASGFHMKKWIYRIFGIAKTIELPMLIYILLKYLSVPHALTFLYMTFWTVLIVITLHRRTVVSRFLFENKAIRFIGKISFSMYLWQYPVAYLFDRYIIPDMFFVVRFGIILLSTIVLSFITYALIEKRLSEFLYEVLSKKVIQKSKRLA